jgi:hypothetical protein
MACNILAAAENLRCSIKYDSKIVYFLALCNIGLVCYFIGKNYAEDSDTHPSNYRRYSALDKLEKYLRAEEYLKRKST